MLSGKVSSATKLGWGAAKERLGGTNDREDKVEALHDAWQAAGKGRTAVCLRIW